MSTTSILIEYVGTTSLDLTVNSSASIEVQLASLTIPIQGIQGIQGISTIGGFGFAISDLQIKDVLRFEGEAWQNTSQKDISDGGNF
jgi:hypothetical protein